MEKLSHIKIKKATFIFCLLFLFAGGLSAQQSNLDSMIIISTGEYRPTITEANKINENPSVNDSTKKLPVKTFGINSKKINTGFEVEPILPAQMVGEPLTKLYNALLKIGMGTYTTPYGEVWYNNLRSKEEAYGLRFKHLSSSATLKNHGYSGFSDNEMSIYGKKFLKEHSLIGNFDYTRNVIHYYGFYEPLHPMSRDAIAQRFNYFAANAELMSHYTKPERYNHDVRLSYYNLSDSSKASENNIKANGFVQTAINKETLKVNAFVDYYNYQTKKDTSNNTIVTLNPNFIANGEKYRASLGVTATMDMFTESKFYFYPNVELSYNVFEDIIIPYAGATGGLKKNSFKTITDQNPFVLSHLTMKNSNDIYELYGGLKGTLSSTIAYNAYVGYSSVSNLAMFMNDTSESIQNKFDVIYDDAKVLNVRGEVSYQNSEKLRIMLRGEYFNYKMLHELRAWYKPQVEVTLSANYNLKDKIVAKVDLFYIDNQYSKTSADDTTSTTGKKIVAKELKGVFDANIGLEYRYTKKLSFFLNLNNIANYRYYRWSNYPTQKISVMGGLSFSF